MGEQEIWEDGERNVGRLSAALLLRVEPAINATERGALERKASPGSHVQSSFPQPLAFSGLYGDRGPICPLIFDDRTTTAPSRSPYFDLKHSQPLSEAIL